MDSNSERTIADCLRRGDDRAWQCLYDRVAHRVWRGVSRLMGNDEAAVADVVQETFLAAARSARSFNPKRGSLWPWLWAIARNQVALHYRKHARTQKLAQAQHWWASLDGDKTKWLASNGAAPPEILASRELAELVRAALAKLPPDYQALLTGRYLDGMSAEQLAAETNSTGSAVRAKLTRARRTFRRTFAEVTGSPESGKETDDEYQRR